MPSSKLDNYDSVRGAEAYKADYRNKLHRRVSDRIERRIFARFFAELGRCGTVLDVPCGAGRLFDLLHEHADAVIEADWSSTMVALDRRDHDARALGYLRCTALALPFGDRCVDLVVSVRLSHHLERPEDREQHLRELFRVADRAVIVTWFSATSLKNVLRVIRAPFDRKRPKNTLRNDRVVRLARAAGFEPVRLLPLSRLGSGHVLGMFRRRDQVGASRRSPSHA